MNPDEEAIVEELRTALQAFNAALEKASAAGLEVDVRHEPMNVIGRPLIPVYHCEVSKKAFSRRI